MAPYTLPREEVDNYIAYHVFSFARHIDLTGCGLVQQDVEAAQRRADAIAPWLYLVAGGTYYTEEDGVTVSGVDLRYTWLDRTAELEVEYRRIVELTQDCKTDLEKALVVHDYVCREITYVLNAPRNIFDVSVRRIAQCEGYAKIYAYYMNRLGVPCEYVSGEVTGGERHAWNRIRIDGKWYLVDPTWDDQSGTVPNTKTPLTRHTLFLKDAASFPQHEIFEVDTQLCTDQAYRSAFWNTYVGTYYAYDGYIYYPNPGSDGGILRHQVGVDDVNDPGKKVAFNNYSWYDRDGTQVTDNYSTPVFYQGKMYYNGPKWLYGMDLADVPNGATGTATILMDIADAGKIR